MRFLIAILSFSSLALGSGIYPISVGLGSGPIKYGNYHLEPSEVNAGNSSTAQTLDWSTGSAQLSTLTGNVTYTFSNPQSAGSYLLHIKTGTGNFSMTWPAAVKWLNPTNTAPATDSSGNQTLIVNFYYDGTNYWGSYAGTY